MQRLISEIWFALALAALIGGLAAWSLMRLWVAKVLARRDQVTMARIKALDESWSERVWSAEDERDKAVARVQVMDERLAAALEHTDALEVQVRGLGAKPIARSGGASAPALTVRIRSVTDGSDRDTMATAELGSHAESASSGTGEIEIQGLELEHVDVFATTVPNGVSRAGRKPQPAPERTTRAPVRAVQVPQSATPTARKSPVDGQLRETDDLTRIEGVGFGFAARLNAMGYWRFEQIAAWRDSDIDTVAETIGTPAARIREGDWVGQARGLLATR